MNSARILSAVRDARWLNAERVRVYCAMLLVGFLVLALWLCLLHLVISPTPDPLGGDFLSFYAASKLALAGEAANAWRPYYHGLAENSLFGGSHGYLAFFYPPPYLLLCFPLALLPYYGALLLWLTTTTAAAVVAIRRYFHDFAPDLNPGWISLFAFPAVWINLSCGQNGALTLAIFAFGFALLDRRPVLAGVIFGLLVMKPQLALTLPFGLAASAMHAPKRWKTIQAAGISAATFCLLAYGVVGRDGYSAFLDNSAYARAALNQGLVNPAILQSLFAALRVFGTPLAAAYAAQTVLSLTVLGFACHAASTRILSGTALGALLAAATLVVTPFSLDYDLMLSAIPLGWLALDSMRNGFRPWDKAIAVAVFFLPLVTRGLDTAYHLPLAPPVLVALFIAVWRRVMSYPAISHDPISSWRRAEADVLS